DGSIPVSFAAQRDWLNQAGSEEMSTVADWSDVVTLPNILTAPDGDRESDRLLMTILFIEAGRYREAQDELRVLLGVHPDDPSLWILQGHSWAGLGELSLADECYSMSTALAPNIAFAWFQRGRGRMDQGRYAEASNDFTRACELQPSFMEAWLNHAICLRKTNRHSDAELVLTHAIELPDVREIPVRAYFLRSDSRAKTGDEQGALADREYALSITPTDEHSWIARGNALVAQDAKAALACFDQALQLNPHSTQAAQNALYVLIEELQQLDVAKIRLLSLVHTRPRDAMARATLSVVLARMGERDGALEQVDALLSLKPTPRQTYQAASALAITGRSHRSDFERAIQLVATAFRLEPELVSLAERDPDMAALRGNPEYHQMVGAVRTLQSK
ncbi:MAG: tetratricopeptide repeat protein, partial [Planctomycetales bacterium]|nr:tetratricopeptide repeat protein [Planctomycetales bacterium]